MTRVDWRWAALKGFWDKEKKCWIESAGGQAAYIQQRMKRVKVRQQRLARQAKAMQRLVPVQNLPFRSGLVEELPYRLDNDPWTEGLGDSRIASISSKNMAPNWFDRKPEPEFSAQRGFPGGIVQVFPFARTGASDINSSTTCSGHNWSKQDNASCASAPQWFETAYATSRHQPSMHMPATWDNGNDSAYHSASGVGAWQAPDPAPTVAVGSWW
jgi:hypothetical protein